MSKYAGATKCPYCGEYVQYEEKDIKANYIESPADLLNGIDLYSKWVDCTKCGKRVDL